VLQVAPSTYYDNKSRPPSRRAVSDAELRQEIRRIWEDNYQAYGAEKIWWPLHRQGVACGRDRVARLMRALGICGVTRQKTTRTTVAKKNLALPADLVRRNFTPPAPNRQVGARATAISGRHTGTPSSVRQRRNASGVSTRDDEQPPLVGDSL
jgi:putative transposase